MASTSPLAIEPIMLSQAARIAETLRINFGLAGMHRGRARGAIGSSAETNNSVSPGCSLPECGSLVPMQLPLTQSRPPHPIGYASAPDSHWPRQDRDAPSGAGE